MSRARSFALCLAPLLASSAFAATAPVASPARAQLVEAVRLYVGASGRVEKTRAFELFRRSAEGGDPAASAWIALFDYLGDEGWESNRENGRRRAQGVLASLRGAASSGDSESEFALGALELYGVGTAVDAPDAARRLARASAGGHVYACHTLAWMRENGRGGPADLDAAEAGYRLCAERGNVESMLALGRLGFNALEGKMPKAEAVGWYRQAAERGSSSGAQWLGNILAWGKGVPADRAEARRWLEKVTGPDEAAARYDLAFVLLASPDGGDRAGAAASLRRAADGPHARAMVQLGWLQVVDAPSEAQAAAGWTWIDRATGYGLDGLSTLFGVESQGPDESRLLASDLARLTRRSDAGSPAAAALLARYLFATGNDEPGEAERVLALSRKAAATGEPHAMRTLGQAYSRGYGVERDKRASAEWYRRGAEAGESFCMMWWSQILFEGKEVAADRTAALRWLERSAEAGNYWAVSDLGHIHDEGWHDLPRDQARALPFKRRLAAVGDAEAIGWLRIHYPELAP